MSTVDRDFVGRRRELAALEAALADASADRPRVVLVHGPAGMGESALLESSSGVARMCGS